MLEAEQKIMNAMQESGAIFFDVKGHFVPKLLGDSIMVRGKYVTFKDDGEIYWFNGKHYEPAECKIAQEVKELLGVRWSGHALTETIKYIQSSTYAERETMELPADYIPVANGLLDWKARELKPFTSDYFITQIHPIEYDSGATCPAIDKFLDEVSGDSTMVFYELAGNSLLRSSKYETAVIIYGTGGNGKTTALQLLNALHGEDNASHVTLQQLTSQDDKFISAELYQKTINVFDDLPKKAAEYTGTLKAIISGSTITAQKKGRDPFHFKPFVKFFFATNEFPKTNDTTFAFWRRWIILAFEKRFEDGKNADKVLIEKLTTKQELSGLLNRAIEGLHSIVSRGNVERSDSAEETRTQWLSNSDPITVFLEKFISVEAGAETAKAEIYPAFQQFSEEQDVDKVPSEESFFKAFKSKFPKFIEVRKKTGTRKLPAIIKGCKLLWVNEENDAPENDNKDSTKDDLTKW